MNTDPKGYRAVLQSVSARTGAPLPSLILSFGILHEVTAVVPLVGIFYGARSLGVGETIVQAMVQEGEGETVWYKAKLREWVNEGDAWAARVGRRYGVFGFEKGQNTSPPDHMAVTSHMAGDIANAVVAYSATKALIPLRIGVSLYLSPAFSRRIIEPVRRLVFRPFKRD